MKEVRAFLHVEDYHTYNQVWRKGLLASMGYQKQHIDTLETIIDAAVDTLVPKPDTKNKGSQN